MWTARFWFLPSAATSAVYGGSIQTQSAYSYSDDNPRALAERTRYTYRLPPVFSRR